MPDPSSSTLLTVFGGPLSGVRLAVVPGEHFIGSDRRCALVLPLPGVAAFHVRLRADASGVAIDDPQNTGTLYLNDQLVQQPTFLRGGDVVWLGQPNGAASIPLRFQARGTEAPAGFSAPIPAVPPPIAATAPVAPDQDEDFLVEELGLGQPSSADAADTPAGRTEPTVVLGPTDEEAPVQPLPAPPEAPLPPQAPIADVDPFYIGETAVRAPVVPEAPVGDEDLFFVEESATPAPVSPAPIAPPVVAAPPHPTAPVSGATPPPVPALPAAAKSAVSVPPTGKPSASTSPAPAPRAPIGSTVPPAAGVPVAARPTPSAPSIPAAPKPPPAAAASATTAPTSATRPATQPSVSKAPHAPTGAAATRPPVRRTTADSGIGIRPRPEMRRPMRRRRGTSPGLIAGVAVAALAVVGGAFAFLRMRSPVLESVNPARVTPGQTVTLRGARFSPDAAANVVRIGDRTVRVTRASAGQIEIEVPDLALTPGQETRLPVVVQVAGRPSQPKEVVFYPTPRIHNLLPDVALAGEEIVVQGRGWGSTPRVRFGELDAEILAVMPDAVRVRVPAIEGSPGTSVEVTVIQGTDISNQWTFVLGKLPLIARLDPSPAAPGDTVTISGRGFGPSMSDNLVRINGQHAVLLSANAMELKFVVPYVSAEGSAPVAVHARGRDRFAEASLNLKPPADPIDLHFVVEPLDDVEGHDHVVIATELGPTFVLSAAGGRSATQRALEAATRLNAATVLVKASLEADFEVKDLETAPILAVVGKPDAVLQVTDEDAAAYNEDWTKQGGRGGSVTRGRLARWWGAVARDLVLLLVRSEKPHCAADLAPEGRALQDVFQSARRATNFGTPRTVLAEMKISQKEALRVIGLRVPASVTGPAVSAAPAPSAPQTVLKLDGAWTITETDSRSRQTASITFQGRSGIYSPAAGVTLQLLSVEPGPRNVRFALQFRGFTRYYDGRWDGLKIAGTISSEASGGGGLGRFEMVRER